MKADINQLRKDSFDLKRDTGVIRQQMTGAAKEESFSAVRESQASLYSQVQEVSKDLQVLQGRFDENKFFMDKAMKDNSIELELLRSQMNKLEMRTKELSEKLAKLSESTAPPVQKPAPEGEDIAEKTPPQRSESDPIKAYEAAYGSFREKHYREARDAFNAFIKKYPKDGLVGNAHFWLGESYYAEKDYENAILAYETLIKNYHHNEKIPGALLKQGLSFTELGDKKTAKVLFDKVMEKYPDSREAEIAKKKKAEIDKKPVKPSKKNRGQG
ncbi:MAG TPA: tol-pal system protein YbgF [Thermodesulfovibrionales bacterium]|nr:tol-pal system protein YbgF [Thermodesulfovibrionales bacterium]